MNTYIDLDYHIEHKSIDEYILLGQVWGMLLQMTLNYPCRAWSCVNELTALVTTVNDTRQNDLCTFRQWIHRTAFKTGTDYPDTLIHV